MQGDIPHIFSAFTRGKIYNFLNSFCALEMVIDSIDCDSSQIRRQKKVTHKSVPVLILPSN